MSRTSPALTTTRRTALAAGLTAAAAAALFAATAPAAHADDCDYGSGIECHVDVYDDPGYPPIYTGGDPYGGSGGYGSGSPGGGGDGGGEGGGEQPPEPAGDASANAAAASNSRERVHAAMQRGPCFTAVTGLAASSANRSDFSQIAGGISIQGAAGHGPSSGLGFTLVNNGNGSATATAYDPYLAGSADFQDAQWFAGYAHIYGTSNADAIAANCR